MLISKEAKRMIWTREIVRAGGLRRLDGDDHEPGLLLPT